MLSAGQVRVVLSCSEEELGVVATNFKVAPGYASSLRKEWVRKIHNQCVHCGAEYTDGHKCSGTILDRTKVWELLGQLHPDAPLLRKKCQGCGIVFTMTVQEVKTAMKGRYIRDVHLCQECLEFQLQKNNRLTFRPFEALRS